MKWLLVLISEKFSCRKIIMKIARSNVTKKITSYTYINVFSSFFQYRSSSQINQTPSQNEDVAPVSPSKENNAQTAEIQRDASMSNENKSNVSALSQVPKAVSPSKDRVEEANVPVITDTNVPLPPAVVAEDEPPSELPPPPPQNKTPVSLFSQTLQTFWTANFEIYLKHCFCCAYHLWKFCLPS